MDIKKDCIIQFGRLVVYKGQDTEIILPNSITIIGRNAFQKTNVHSVVLPDTIKEIETCAFLGADIKQISIHSEIQKLGSSAFPCNESIAQCIYPKIAIATFPKKEQFHAFTYFVEHADKNVYDPKVYTQNISFIGKHMLQKTNSGIAYCDILIEKSHLFHEIIASGTIPMKNIDEIISHFFENTKTNADILAELMQYKNELKNTVKGKKRLAKEQKKKDNALLQTESPILSVADWRKLYKFKYENGNVVITECHSKEHDPLIIPNKIGTRNVQTIGSCAFDGHIMIAQTEFYPEKELPHKRMIIIPKGVSEIQSRAFYCISNMEIFLPNTVFFLPKGTFCAVSFLRIHIPDSVTEIEEELIWDSLDYSITIIASKGSYAETYAKKYHLRFEAEN